jgi:hypothetical protein
MADNFPYIYSEFGPSSSNFLKSRQGFNGRYHLVFISDFFKQISSNPLASIQETDELENFGPSAES